VITGQHSPLQGWISPGYGEKAPAPVVRLRHRAAAPFIVGTLVFPTRSAEEVSPHVEAFSAWSESEELSPSMANGILVKTSRFTDLLLCRGSWTGLFRVDDWETDAMVARVRLEGEGGAVLGRVGGSFVRRR
jgi:hypothetical protein